MFLKKKAHNLFAKSVRLALKGVKGSVVTKEVKQTDESENVTVEHEAVDEIEIVKPKKTYSRSKKTVDEE